MPGAGQESPFEHGSAMARRGRVVSAVVLAAVAVLLALGLVVQPVGRLGTCELRLAGFRLPTTCGFRLSTGIPCASCGLTRAVVLLLHGRVRDSWDEHPFGGMALALTLLLIPPRIPALAGRRPSWVGRWDRAWVWVMIATLGAMVGRWILDLVFFGVPGIPTA